MSALRCARLAAALVVGLAAAPHAAGRLTVMHGFVDYASALVWIQAEAPGPVDVAWRVEGDPREQTVRYEARAEDDHIVRARLSGLAPGRVVTYRIVGDHDERSGRLRTQRHWTASNDAPELAIAIGSCFYLAGEEAPFRNARYGGGYGIFDAIADKRPDVMVWMGDYLYFLPPDEFDPASMAARYRRQRTLPALAKLLTATSHVATWDDHDYGPNDADASYVMKGESLARFRRYWANPSFGLPEVPGVFGRTRLGDVDLFLLDDRYYRSANGLLDGPDKTMWGAQQLAWLKNALVHSEARIKLVVNGTQMWNRANRFESGSRFATEQRAFADWLLAQRVDGVVFLSGDRHFSELLRIDRPGAYPLYEFTSSPLTSEPWDIQDPQERGNPDIVPGTFVAKRQFGMVRVRGPGDDRRLVLESYDETGTLLWQHELRARDLRFPKP